MAYRSTLVAFLFLCLTVSATNMVLVSNSNANGFDLLGLFRALAKDDFNRSVELAKSFTGEAPRSAATIAIARSVLEKGNADSQTLD